MQNIAKYWQLAVSSFFLIGQSNFVGVFPEDNIIWNLLFHSFCGLIKNTKKPSDAGLKKKPGQKRRGNLRKADLFVDKVRGYIDHSSSDLDATAPVVTLLKVKKQKKWEN